MEKLSTQLSPLVCTVLYGYKEKQPSFHVSRTKVVKATTEMFSSDPHRHFTSLPKLEFFLFLKCARIFSFLYINPFLYFLFFSLSLFLMFH